MSLDLLAVHLALRSRALSLVVATTGSTTLSATAAGYARASGSFITDGFREGMELNATGFAVAGNNGPHVITAGGVSALALTCSGCSVDAAAAGRTLSVGIPTLRSFENVRLTPLVGRHFFEEDFVPATSSVFTIPASSGDVYDTGLYILKWYGLPGTGVSALRKSVDALKARFAPGTQLTAGTDFVRIRGDQAPYTGQIIPLSSWSVLTLTVPWRVRSVNAIAA